MKDHGTAATQHPQGIRVGTMPILPPVDAEADRVVTGLMSRLRAAEPEPPPQRLGGTRVLDLVIADLEARARVGREKYGTYLETNNGRDALMDAYQEALDLCMYLRQTIAERSVP